MSLKRIATAAAVAALAMTQAERVQADAGDFVAGAIVGGLIGGAIAKDAQKKKKKTTYSNSGKKPAASNVQRESNRQVQEALNYWGFPVGTPDGAIGPKSRAAITDFQLSMGWPGTGELTEFEREFLVSSYQRAQAGGGTTAALILQNPMGAKGVLMAWRDERLAATAPGKAPLNPFLPAGTAAQQAPQPAANPFVKPGTDPAAGVTAAADPAPAPGAAPLPTFAAAAAPEPAAPATAAPALPTFLATAKPEPVISLASHCSKVSLLTNSNGGFVTPVTMTDPNFALSEQFCLARTYGISQGEELTAKVAGFSAAQIADQCNAFAPVLQPFVDAVSAKPRDAVIAEVQGFVAGSGMAAEQLGGTAKICLGVGYTTDRMDVALGSALLLAALGERSYEELVGHHLSQGIGATMRPDLALKWYEGALGQVGDVVQSSFAPGMADRADLIRMAAYAVAGENQPGGVIIAPVEEQTAPAAQPETGGGGGGLLPFRLPYLGGRQANP